MALQALSASARSNCGEVNSSNHESTDSNGNLHRNWPRALHVQPLERGHSTTRLHRWCQVPVGNFPEEL